MNIDNLKQLAISENGFVFDPSSGYSYTVNETGLNVLKLLISGMNKEQVLESILSEDEVGADHFESDLDHYMLMLEAFDLVER